MVNLNLRQIFDGHPGLADEIAGRGAREQAERKARLDAFYDGSRFNEILNYILGHDGVIDQDEVRHFSDRHPISQQEFSDFCHALFERYTANIQTIDNGPFLEKVLCARGLKITLLVGQGSLFFVSRERSTQSMPSPPKPVMPG